MKKNLLYGMGVLLCAALSAAGLTACSSNTNTETTVAESNAAVQPDAVSTETEEIEIKLPDYTFTMENFPRMDGSTATVPLAEAVAGKLLGVDSRKTESLCMFNRTTQSFRNLMAGECDLLIVSEPQAKVFDEMKEAGFRYKMEPIATDALIFVVNESNPVDSLTTEQIRDIYTGKITNWKEVGGNDERIIPFQRNAGAGSQALMVKLVMGNTPLMQAPEEYVPTSMGDLMKAVKSYDNSANAIGYSVYYYANDMKMAKGLKIISVDGVEPGAETIRSGAYPHLNSYFCVIPEDTNSEGAKVIYDWLVTEDGQKLINSVGYVSIMDVGAGAKSGMPAANFTRLDNAPEGTLTSVKARNDYGKLYPYSGIELCEKSYSDVDDDDDAGSYVEGYMKGFFDEHGRLVTDPVYNSIDTLKYYNRENFSDIPLPGYVAIKYDSDSIDPEGYYDNYREETHSFYISLDGSFVSPDYEWIMGMKDHVLCIPVYSEKDFVVYDLDGNIVFTYEMLDKANNGKFSNMGEDYGFASSLDYGDGYYLISCGAEGYYYVDENTFELKFGPYQYATPFVNGKALVYDADPSGVGDSYAKYIDKQGKELTPAYTYRYMAKLPNGNLLGGNGKDTHVLDPKGNELMVLRDTGYYSVTRWGFTTSPQMADGRYGTDMYNCDGEKIFSDPEGIYYINEMQPIVSISGDPNGAKAGDADNEGSGMWITNVINGKSVFVDGADSCYPFYTFEGVSDIPYIQVGKYDYENDQTHMWIMDEKLHVIQEADDYLSALQDNITGEWYICESGYTSGEYKVYDQDLKLIVKSEDSPQLYDKTMITVSKHCSIAKTPDGREIFCYPMTGSLGN